MSPTKTRIHEIDGLRGIAILSILILHWVVQPFKPLLKEQSYWQGLNLFAYGVDLFFVISGFLIGGILLSIGKNLKGMGSFYIRRILRIWPLYYALLGLTVLLANGAPVFFDIPYWTFFLFIFNFWESAGFKLHEVLGPLWSIAIEEQFYILGPIIFLLLNRKQLIFLMSSYLIAAPIIRILIELNTSLNLWRFTPARLDGICMGILLALIFSYPENVAYISSKIKSLKALIASLSLVILALVFSNNIGYNFQISLIVLTLGLVVMTVQAQSLLQQKNPILNIAFLRYMGMRCYSIYLFHIFFMFITRAIIKDFIIGLFVQFALTIGFAHLSWKHLEAPLIKFGRKFSYGGKTP